MKLSALVSTAVLAACACVPAAAEVVVYDFTGTIYQIEEYNLRGWGKYVNSSSMPGETVAVGQTVSGRISFSTDTQPRSTETAPNGDTDYRYDNLLPIRMRIDGTGIGYGTNGQQTSQIGITDRLPDGWGQDSLGFYAGTPGDQWVEPQQAVGFSFTDRSAHVIGSDALAGLADLSRFPANNLTYSYADGFDVMQASARLTSLTRVSPVPEPSVPLMMLTAGGVLALLRRRAGKAAA